jgi:hypothetical protein
MRLSFIAGLSAIALACPATAQTAADDLGARMSSSSSRAVFSEKRRQATFSKEPFACRYVRVFSTDTCPR